MTMTSSVCKRVDNFVVEDSVAMTTGEKRCDWWSALLGDDELFTDVQLPAHVTDEQFILLLQQVSLSSFHYGSTLCSHAGITTP